MNWEFVDPLDKRADCEEDYISPPYALPTPDDSGSSESTGSSVGPVDPTDLPDLPDPTTEFDWLSEELDPPAPPTHLTFIIGYVPGA